MEQQNLAFAFTQLASSTEYRIVKTALISFREYFINQYGCNLELKSLPLIERCFDTARAWEVAWKTIKTDTRGIKILNRRKKEIEVFNISQTQGGQPAEQLFSDMKIKIKFFDATITALMEIEKSKSFSTARPYYDFINCFTYDEPNFDPDTIEDNSVINLTNYRIAMNRVYVEITEAIKRVLDKDLTGLNNDERQMKDFFISYVISLKRESIKAWIFVIEYVEKYSEMELFMESNLESIDKIVNRILNKINKEIINNFLEKK